MVSVADVTTRFAECRSVSEANKTYKELFTENQVDGASEDWWNISEGHRRSMERLQGESIVISKDVDPNKIHPRLLRNWAAKEGLPLAKHGRVSIEIENQYRAAHDLPLIVGEQIEPVVIPEGVTSGDIRAWARESGIEVGDRGRVNPSIITQYIEATKGSDQE